uniref:Ceramide synthase 3b n=1 Tax=Lepisosteus oculatus TaxID=7918 RepID=W5N4X9_LEPOC
TIHEWFWWHRIWLPVNLTWADLEDKDGRVYAKPSHLYITILYAVVFLIVRHVFERLIATPVAKCFGIKDTVRLKAVQNPVLEKYFCSNSKNPTQSEINGLSKKCNWSERQVERWFRRRRNQERPGILKKFREASWRFTFYLSAFIGGLVALYDVSTATNSILLLSVFLQSLMESQYWYYIIEMSFYWSLLFRVAFDVKRKDFREQIVHHLATLLLLGFSWFANYIRIGTLVMVTHDASDVLLESAKMFNYAKWTTACNLLFVLFALVFFITRLIIFPFWLIHCTWVYPVQRFPAFFGYYFFNVMLVVLQLLHIFWAYLILCMLKKFLFGNVS